MNPSNILAKGKKVLSNVFSAGVNMYTQAPRTMGEGVGKAIVAPFEARRLETDRQTDRLMQDRQMSRDPQSAARYAERSANNQEAFGKSLQQDRKKVIVGTLGTIGTLASVKAPKAVIKPVNVLAKSRMPVPQANIPTSVPMIGQPRDAVGRWAIKAMNPKEAELTAMAKIWSSAKGSLANLTPQKRKLFNEYVSRVVGNNPQEAARFMSMIKFR